MTRPVGFASLSGKNWQINPLAQSLSPPQFEVRTVFGSGGTQSGVPLTLVHSASVTAEQSELEAQGFVQISRVLSTCAQVKPARTQNGSVALAQMSPSTAWRHAPPGGIVQRFLSPLASQQ
jgi:hypothetical protein